MRNQIVFSPQSSPYRIKIDQYISVFSIETQYIIPSLEGCWKHLKTLLY